MQEDQKGLMMIKSYASSGSRDGSIIVRIHKTHRYKASFPGLLVHVTLDSL